MPTFSFHAAPTYLTVHLLRGINAPLPRGSLRALGFGGSLMPVHHPRLTARLVSCYALFE